MTSSFISELWNKWNIRSFVILSLLLQVFLTLFAPLRKKTTNPIIIFLLWLAYLMADWAVVFGIRLISSVQGNSCACAVEVDEAFQAFWASFLLLYLGGSDNITAFSLEDNSLWRRHLLTLIFQVGIVIYFFVQIFPSNKLLVIPTMLLCFAGVIKNAERILALIFSSFPRLKEWLVSQHERHGPQQYMAEIALYPLVEEHYVLGVGYNDEEAKLGESTLAKQAYCFFQVAFRAFIGDLMFTGAERTVYRNHFCRVSAMDALRLISIELQFIYEVLYTKRMALSSPLSYIFRFIAFTNVAMSFVLFNRLKKHQLLELDVKITYFLFFGGIALDVISLSMLVFSDLNVARFKVFNTRPSELNSFLNLLISGMDYQRKPQFSTCKVDLITNITYNILDTPLIFRRWSESISACNLFSECLKESPRKMYKHNRCWSIISFPNICSSRFRGVEKIIACFCQAKGYASTFCIYGPLPVIANTMYVSKNPFIMKLWIFIFQEVKRKSDNASELSEVKKIFEARGQLFLKSESRRIHCHNLLVYVTNANYDSSIFMWHIATEIWYNIEDQSMSPTHQDAREFSKILSDYMFYLLVNQHNVVSAVAGLAQVTSGQLLLELRRHYIHGGINDVKGLCMTLFRNLKIGTSKILAGGVNLAREIEGLQEKKWEVMRGVWIEMLTYAAGHIKGEAHVQVLSQGGELLAFVWLLMAHFGCFYSPEWGAEREIELGNDSTDQEEDDRTVETEYV